MNLRQIAQGIFIMSVCFLLSKKSLHGQIKAPQLTPLSPNAASLWKYAELPVNLYTGIPSISIPIFEAKSGDLKVPITLSYHAGGIRFEEQASWVGLGWTLNAGGAISRNVKGIADEKGILNPGNFYMTNATNCSEEYFANVLNKVYDVQPMSFLMQLQKEMAGLFFGLACNSL